MRESSSTSIFGIDLGPKGQGSLRESKIDLFAFILMALMALLGWLNLYAISYEDGSSIFDLGTHHGKQALFLLFSFALGGFVLYLDTKFLEFVSYIAYGLSIFTLIAVLTVSAVKGSASWFEVGGFKFQPTEFAKVATLMALGKFMSRYNFSLRTSSGDVLTCMAIVAVPMLLVLLQNDAGSALVFFGMIFIFFREGMHPIFLIGGGLMGLNIVLSILLGGDITMRLVLATSFVIVVLVSWVFIFRLRFVVVHILACLLLASLPFGAGSVLKPHQSARLRVLTASSEAIKDDKVLNKTYYNLHQSMVAIGSGGWTGKGYANSTHTRGDFVPEEHTDYIFCVVGEEHGFFGAVLVLVMYFLLLWRILHMAEYAKSRYALVYGYGAASIIFMHVFVNVGMTIGLLPTVGIPLPFFSYGGSSTISFTLMLFVLLNHYSYRTNILT